MMQFNCIKGKYWSGQSFREHEHLNSNQIMAKSRKRKAENTDGKVTPAKDAVTATAASKIHDSAASAISNEPNQESSKRKRKSPASSHSTPKKSDLFNGLTLAISTLESKTLKSEDNLLYANFKSLSNLLKTHGATISPQVHKRVHYLICTIQAVENLTQRVRQAIRRNVDVLNVDWIEDCIERGERVDPQSYLLNDLAQENNVMQMKKKKDESVTVLQNNDAGYESNGSLPDENAAGWSEPIALDCCCVCHENGDEDCPWCMECNINLAKKK